MSTQAQPQPLVLVAAAGGGIRAGYWTARVLGEISRKAPDFSNRLFAASGVSGGSLGLGSYYAALAEGPQRCGRDTLACTEAFYNADFLAGPLTATLVSWPGNIFLPGSPMPTRSAALETGWERAWKGAVRGPLAEESRFARPLQKLFDGRRHKPILILNATSASSGDRILSANVNTRGWFSPSGSCQVNLAEQMNMPMSAAVGASARFPVITDWGWFAADGVEGCDRFEGVADGGFYDNYGAATLLDLIGGLQALGVIGAPSPAVARQEGAQSDTQPAPVRHKPIVIQITSDPDASMACVLSLLDRDTAPDFTECGKAARQKALPKPNGWQFFQLISKDEAEAKAAASRMWQNSTYSSWSPGYPGLISVLSRARVATGIRTAQRLRATVRGRELGGCYYHFSMTGLDDVPLGWTLSTSTRRKIDISLSRPANQVAMAALVRELRQPSPDCGYGDGKAPPPKGAEGAEAGKPARS